MAVASDALAGAATWVDGAPDWLQTESVLAKELGSAVAALWSAGTGADYGRARSAWALDRP